MTLAEILLSNSGSAAGGVQILERNKREVSTKFFEAVVTYLSQAPGIEKGSDIFGKRGTAFEQTVAKFIVPKAVAVKCEELVKVIAWKQNSESVICPEADMDVKIVRSVHVKDENDAQTEQYEILVGQIMQNKGMVVNPPIEKDTKKPGKPE